MPSGDTQTLFIDMTGRRCGRLVALTHAESDGSGGARWCCKCDCGNECVVRGSALRSGRTKSCGCLANEAITTGRAARGRWGPKLSDEELKRRKNERRRRWMADNPDQRERARKAARARHRMKSYGLTVSEYDALIALGCAICGAHADQTRLEMDHNHRNGKVRAALCVRCNTGIGRFEDDSALLRAAAQYIEEMP